MKFGLLGIEILRLLIFCASMSACFWSANDVVSKGYAMIINLEQNIECLAIKGKQRTLPYALVMMTIFGCTHIACGILVSQPAIRPVALA